jgi:diacylglycerol kinase family enzyme
LLVLHNPLAGSRRARGRLDDVLACLRERDCSLDVRRTESPAETRRAAGQAGADGGCDAVVAAGGDGTVRATARALVGTPMPLGIIPVGTGNVLAHEIGLALEPDAIADCIVAGRTTTVRTANANGEPFFLMVGAGFDGRVIARLDVAWKRRVGKLAYVWPVTTALLAGPDRLRVRIDGVEHAAGWAVPTLRRRYAGAFVLAPEARLEDEAIHAVMLKPRGRLALLGQLAWMAVGAIAQRADVADLPGSTIEITADAPVPVQIDGEPFGTTPVRITMGGAGLTLIVP